MKSLETFSEERKKRESAEEVAAKENNARIKQNFVDIDKLIKEYCAKIGLLPDSLVSADDHISIEHGGQSFDMRSEKDGEYILSVPTSIGRYRMSQETKLSEEEMLEQLEAFLAEVNEA